MTIEELTALIREEVRREMLPVDQAAYQRAGKDPCEPILFAGSLVAPVVIFGRDLGKDEVKHGQPLIGAGGKLVREGVLQAWEHPETPAVGTRGMLENALGYVLLTNTVPFKPPGNKAYSEPIKQRFRPFLLQLLTRFWGGHHIITLGNEAFRWFEPHGSRDEFQGRGRTDDRFTSVFHCCMQMTESEPDRISSKQVKVLPLPHPSPLNRRWRSQFPSMLARRLREVRLEIDTRSHA